MLALRNFASHCEESWLSVGT